MNNGLFDSSQPTGYWRLQRDIFKGFSGTWIWRKPPGVFEINVWLAPPVFANGCATFSPGNQIAGRIINPPAQVSVSLSQADNGTCSFGSFLSNNSQGSGAWAPGVEKIGIRSGAGGSLSPEQASLTFVDSSLSPYTDIFGTAANLQQSKGGHIIVEYMQWISLK